MIALSDWWRGGAFINIDGHRIFTRSEGEGKTVVFLHGFPTSSHDWADVIYDLSRDFRCVTFDYLGYGASDKPVDADYSSIVQTDRALAVLEKLGVDDATVVGHDLGGILLQQFLERGLRSQMPLAMERAIFINSSVYADLYRPTPTQTALADPVHGPALARAITGSMLEDSMATLFPGHPLSSARFAELWEAIAREDGHHLWPQQLIYMSERAALGGVWEKALHETSTPLGFVYGLADPISGAQILSHAEADLPDATCIGLAGLGHFPQVEAAGDVARALRVILESETQA